MNLITLLCFIAITATATMGTGLKLEVHGDGSGGNMTGGWPVQDPNDSQGCFYPDCMWKDLVLNIASDDNCKILDNCYIDLETGEKHQLDGCTFPICYYPTDDENKVEDDHCKSSCYIDLDTGEKHHDKSGDNHDSGDGDHKKHSDDNNDKKHSGDGHKHKDKGAEDSLKEFSGEGETEGCVYPECYTPTDNPAVGYDDNCKPPNCFLDLND